ncbi:uncharacterized protein LOC144153680 [Haemaphysalis longicornis]|uniref:Uncharacterized protein n=1 Tax=Haemaphysalis longicornis TaxID=44386 RepID=A0A9J6F7B5_HAELO|nr:hypothetical protein HPB48_005185 [Haemaphysalis longicornis]
MARGNDAPMEVDAANPGSDNNNDEENADSSDVEQLYAEEYEALSTAMDEINACLDVLERKNNELFLQMRKLLDEHKKGNGTDTTGDGAAD